MTRDEAAKKLQTYGQEHVLQYYDALSPAEQEELLLQIEETDFSVLSHAKDGVHAGKRGVFSPLQATTIDEINQRRQEFHDAGVSAIRSGKVAALLLAGGMGTRLGSDNPKGMYDIGETKHVYIFQRLIENLLDVVKETDTWIRLFIMTSEKNHDATVQFFEEQDYFGYQKDRVVFFKQDMAPACDYNGKAYMEAKNKISTSPNGNGGWFSSMVRCGLIDYLKEVF